MARSAILSITKSTGFIPSVSPFDKGGWGDFKIDFLGWLSGFRLRRIQRLGSQSFQTVNREPANREPEQLLTSNCDPTVFGHFPCN
jgi:hypothetical protein